MDLDLLVRGRSDEETFRVCLFDRVHCLGDVTQYEGKRGPTGLGAASLVSAYTWWCYLILWVKRRLDCLMEHSMSRSMTRGGRNYPLCLWRLRARWNCEAVMYTFSSVSFVFVAGITRDWYLNHCSRTKVGNRSHNNRCVSFLWPATWFQTEWETQQDPGQQE